MCVRSRLSSPFAQHLHPRPVPATPEELGEETFSLSDRHYAHFLFAESFKIFGFTFNVLEVFSTEMMQKLAPQFLENEDIECLEQLELNSACNDLLHVSGAARIVGYL